MKIASTVRNSTKESIQEFLHSGSSGTYIEKKWTHTFKGKITMFSFVMFCRKVTHTINSEPKKFFDISFIKCNPEGTGIFKMILEVCREINVPVSFTCVDNEVLQQVLVKNKFKRLKDSSNAHPDYVLDLGEFKKHWS